MRKITFLLLCLIPLLGAVNAQTVEQLLERSSAAGNPLGIEQADLFNDDERLLLQEHFNSESTVNTTEELAIGDVYLVSIYGGCDLRGYGKFPLTGPFTMNIIKPTTTQFYAGDRDDSGNLYGVNGSESARTLVKINPTTGVETVVGPLINLGNNTPTGLAWNSVNQTMYALSSDVYVTKLYTVELESGELTLIGELGITMGIWLAIDPLGNAFTVNLQDNFLYSVNLETGLATSVGSIGTSVQKAQDADFDPQTGILYAVGYHGGGANGFYSVNTTTGKYTKLGSVNNNCAQIGLVSIQGQQVGVKENSVEGFSFYPNPATDFLNLKSVENLESVIIFDLLGQKVIESRANGTDSQLDISSLSTGIYIMKVQANGKTGSYKLVKN